MKDIDFTNEGNKTCLSLSAVLGIKNGFVGGPYSSKLECVIDGIRVCVEIEQQCKRKINLVAMSPIKMVNLLDFYMTLENLLMLFDGRFYDIESLSFKGSSLSQEEYNLFANEYISRRLSCYMTDPNYCYRSHRFLNYYEVLSSEIILRWIKLQKELDIVHKVALYNIADTGVTYDVKCANFIECLEPVAEIVGLYDRFFPSLKPGDKTTTLKMCIDSVISKYGQDIFSKEYNVNKDKFLQTLVNTRHRIMHIKRNQPVEKYLSGAESTLYLVKICHLYRVIIFSLLGIDYEQYQSAVVKSVEQWDSWNSVLTNFINAMK